MITCTKTFADLPFAHRQHNHDGHCSLIHGHNWSFTFTFGASSLDDNGFVIDFGKLKWMRKDLETMFDHTLVLNQDDPYLSFLRDSLTHAAVPGAPFAKIVVVPNCGAEGLAEFVMDIFNPRLLQLTEGRVFIQSLQVHEDTRNSATITRDV